MPFYETRKKQIHRATALFIRIDTFWRRNFFEAREERSAHVANMGATNDEEIRKNGEPKYINPGEQRCVCITDVTLGDFLERLSHLRKD